MKINKSREDLMIIEFERAKSEYDNGHRFLAWYWYTENGEIVEYNDDERKYPAPDCRYPYFN